jgi:putative peptidoglycan lipid II flippase
MTLAAYSIGLLPFVLIRSVVATFFARGDTATPVKASLSAAVVNIALKVLLMGSLAQVGLALATAIGAWINLLLVGFFAWRKGFLRFEAPLRRSAGKLVIAGVILAVFLVFVGRPLAGNLSAVTSFPDQAALALSALGGGLIYGAGVLILLGPRWLKTLAERPVLPAPSHDR